MTKLLKVILQAIGFLGNVFIASLAVYCAINDGKDDPVYAAISIGVIIAMWNVFIFCCTHWED